MAFNKAKTPSAKPEPRTEDVPATVEAPVQTSASQTVTDGTDPAKRDPYHGQGGVYVINDKGERVRA